MTVQEQLTEDLKTAMKAHDKLSLNVIRMIKAAMTNEQVKIGHDLTDEETTAVLSRELKQRKESVAEFTKGDRQDLVDQTNAEIEIVEKYAPKQLTEDEVKAIVAETVSEVGASSMGDFGKVMGAVMPKLKGRADGNIVNQSVKALLQK